MEIDCVWEHNGHDTLLYAVGFPGAYARGSCFQEAIEKMAAEIRSYCCWAGVSVSEVTSVRVIQDVASGLAICDADSDVIFDLERLPLTMEEYMALKELVLKSARDFHLLYASIPDPLAELSVRRCSFYGEVPSSADEMYQHTKSVNAYYFGEIGVDTDNDGDIEQCRRRGFKELEKVPNFLSNVAIEGSYGEMWSLRKMLRRFLWHDRIHAKALYRRAVIRFPDCVIPNVFFF